MNELDSKRPRDAFKQAVQEPFAPNAAPRSPDEVDTEDQVEPARQSAHAALRLLADAPITHQSQDLLGFGAYASAIAGLIDNPQTATPLTLAINARWGAGKSSLGRMIRGRLEDKPAAGGKHPHRTHWFNAWMHDDASSLATAFVSDLVQTADAVRPLWSRMIRPLPMSLTPASERPLRTLYYWGVLAIVFLLAMLVFLFWVDFDEAIYLYFVPGGGSDSLEINGRLGAIASGASAMLTFLFALSRPLVEVGRSVGDFLANPDAAASAGNMERVRKQLGALLEAATPRGGRFVIFVDDLDRVRPPEAVELLESVNQLLTHPNVVVVVVADLPAIAAQAELKYAGLAAKFASDSNLGRPDGVVQSYGRQYLQKIVQLQFDLPGQNTLRMKQFVEQLSEKLADTPPPPPPHPLERLRLQAKARMLARRRNAEFADARARAFALISEDASLLQSAELPEHLLADLTLDADRARLVLEEQRSLKLHNDSGLLDEALREAAEHLPPSPRNAKRILNRLRLLLHLARERGLLEGQSPVTPVHIGHWAVLQERWPELVQRLGGAPDRLAVLEAAARADDDSFDAELKKLVSNYGRVDALRACLAGDVRLGHLAPALVAFAPELLPGAEA